MAEHHLKFIQNELGAIQRSKFLYSCFALEYTNNIILPCEENIGISPMFSDAEECFFNFNDEDSGYTITSDDDEQHYWANKIKQEQEYKYSPQL